ncbi:MAG: hypothetical protein A3G35_09760 [candidate division NC10 bacterium RIFCSPLOWO2_12_FULL_66_18]|nr:MAG: hypothetical protein A3H39_04010 [candidate division NC10 bacterium RIFCSPLOWO2_02_FULL_66_22]OGC01000.1 MAG: hypothetical protein A3G35_09760 [candidate division NC10 bacterium RIFCSPLOWO2_12_FULL_66_18]
MNEGQHQEGRTPGFDMRGPMWAIHHKVVSLPIARGSSLEDRLRLVEEELAVRDVLTRYTYYYDGNDLDGTMTVFHDDCLLINPRGTYKGKEAIRRNYAYLMSQRRFVFHYATNVAVRLLDDGLEAWMTAYYYGVDVSGTGVLSSTAGTYADRLVKVEGEWKIIERRITYNYRHVLSPEPPIAAGRPPEPTAVETSRDLIGPDAML